MKKPTVVSIKGVPHCAESVSLADAVADALALRDVPDAAAAVYRLLDHPSAVRWHRVRGYGAYKFSPFAELALRDVLATLKIEALPDDAIAKRVQGAIRMAGYA